MLEILSKVRGTPWERRLRRKLGWRSQSSCLFRPRYILSFCVGSAAQHYNNNENSWVHRQSRPWQIVPLSCSWDEKESITIRCPRTRTLSYWHGGWPPQGLCYFKGVYRIIPQMLSLPLGFVDCLVEVCVAGWCGLLHWSGTLTLRSKTEQTSSLFEIWSWLVPLPKTRIWLGAWQIYRSFERLSQFVFP